ncbi:hypothetical protein [Arsenicicoccus bolidensis]|uniref:Thymidylate synthase n=1 Tax=Arsenicicoccus bolidensis TaxID=229480 RepID=A0ABS9Q0E6_9MICO|nr:hypothetical protein [Arsenicicoccus bolidensis]MCG7321348.1 hypothetical protein [Arsenicicoccus bolidensis]
MSLYVEPAENLAEAWLRTLEAVHAQGGNAVNVITTVTDPCAPDSPAIRSAVDALLVDGHRSGTRLQSIETVAGTIFPAELYNDPGEAFDPTQGAAQTEMLDGAAEDLYDAYLDILPTLRTDRANKSGTYFSRMISWPGKTADGTNQVAARITSLRAARVKNHTRRNIDDIVIGGEAEQPVDPVSGLQVYAATDRRTMGFPCLVHVDLTLYQGHLSMAAVYRHQLLITKAYGNLLGLARLLRFLADQSGFEVGELMISATMANAEHPTYTKGEVAALIAAARQDTQ